MSLEYRQSGFCKFSSCFKSQSHSDRAVRHLNGWLKKNALLEAGKLVISDKKIHDDFIVPPGYAFDRTLIFRNVEFTGKATLANVRFHGNLEFYRCRLEKGLCLENVRVDGSLIAFDCTIIASEKNLSGSAIGTAINLERADVHGHLDFRYNRLVGRFTATRIQVTGAMRLAGTHIKATEDVFPDEIIQRAPMYHQERQSFTVLSKFDVLSGCWDDPALGLVNARIGGTLDLGVIWAESAQGFREHPIQAATVVCGHIDAQGIHVGGRVLLQGLFCHGFLSFQRAEIGGSIEASALEDKVATVDGESLQTLYELILEGDLNLINATVKGNVRLAGAYIGKNLDLTFCRIKNMLDARSYPLHVGGNMIMSVAKILYVEIVGGHINGRIEIVTGNFGGLSFTTGNVCTGIIQGFLGQEKNKNYETSSCFTNKLRIDAVECKTDVNLTGITSENDIKLHECKIDGNIILASFENAGVDKKWTCSQIAITGCTVAGKISLDNGEIRECLPEHKNAEGKKGTVDLSGTYAGGLRIHRNIFANPDKLLGPSQDNAFGYALTAITSPALMAIPISSMFKFSSTLNMNISELTASFVIIASILYIYSKQINKEAESAGLQHYNYAGECIRHDIQSEECKKALLHSARIIYLILLICYLFVCYLLDSKFIYLGSKLFLVPVLWLIVELFVFIYSHIIALTAPSQTGVILALSLDRKDIRKYIKTIRKYCQRRLIFNDIKQVLLFFKNKEPSSNAKPIQPQLDLSHARIRTIDFGKSTSEYPFPTMNLYKLETEHWEFNSKHFDDLDILDNITEYDSEIYVRMERLLRNRGHHERADVIHREMKRQEQSRETRGWKNAAMLLHSLTGYGTRRDKALIFMIIWFSLTTVWIFLEFPAVVGLKPETCAMPEHNWDRNKHEATDLKSIMDPNRRHRLGVAVAMALQNHVPLIDWNLPWSANYQSKGIMSFYLLIVQVVHWILWPLLLAGLIQTLIPRREPFNR